MSIPPALPPSRSAAGPPDPGPPTAGPPTAGPPGAAGPARPSRPGLSGGIPLFRVFGIQVFLHWTWFIVAFFEISRPIWHYSSAAWNVLEYLTLFAIVLLHEFGHALACLSVGGRAERIMLWPLGGVAFVRPPERAGAVLWSIVAGPLVNVVLLPVTWGLAIWLGGRPGVSPDLEMYAKAIAFINLVILAFNLLPIYPLDGGQILRALLWFVIGRARSLTVAAAVGMVGAAGMLIFAVTKGQILLIVLAAFGLMVSWNAVRQGRGLRALASAPRRTGGATGEPAGGATGGAPGPRCPACGAPPPVGTWWRCACGQVLDPFEIPACPRCGRDAADAVCPDCGTASPLVAWYPDPSAMPRRTLVPLLTMPPPPDAALLGRDPGAPDPGAR